MWGQDNNIKDLKANKKIDQWSAIDSGVTGKRDAK
jgi:hypothetical protein